MFQLQTNSIIWTNLNAKHASHVLKIQASLHYILSIMLVLEVLNACYVIISIEDIRHTTVSDRTIDTWDVSTKTMLISTS